MISALRHTAPLVETKAVSSRSDERHRRSGPGLSGNGSVCHNPLLGEYRRRKRENLVAATEEDLAKIAREVARRTKTPLLAPQIAEKVGRVKNRYSGQALRLVIEDGRLYARRTAAIAREAQLDGFYIIRTSEPESGCDRLSQLRRMWSEPSAL